MEALASYLMGDRVPCQALVPPRRHRFGGLPSHDRGVMSPARLFPSPEQSCWAASSKSCE